MNKNSGPEAEVVKDGWSPEMIRMVVAILLNDKVRWVHWFKVTNRSWATDDMHEYDKNWAAVFVLSDLTVSACFKSWDQFLAYLKEMMNRHVPPLGARDPKRFRQARVAYIQQMIAFYKV